MSSAQKSISKQDKELIESSPQLSQLEEQNAAFMLDFARANYRKIVSTDGKSININGKFHNITKIVRAVEDRFAELENNLNKVAGSMDPKEIRAALYEFITFATAATEADLDEADRGELKNIALILGLMQKGFRYL